MYREKGNSGDFPRLYCTFCGAGIGRGESYWSINGSMICQACLPAYARQDYESCRTIRGEEART